MKSYKDYKKYWILTQAPSLVPSLYWGETAEQAFEVHISQLGLYKLMEILSDWYEE